MTTCASCARRTVLPNSRGCVTLLLSELWQLLTRVKKKEEQRIARERAQLKWQKEHAYDDLFTEENMAGSSNQDRDENWEEDFM
jgi:hypothetical protein